jgi:ABC-type lipoprotein export system ATPase subunit
VADQMTARLAPARVELQGICKHFGAGETRVDALVDISLKVHAGETVGLRGASGSGKSTLLNVIGCVAEPSAGWMRLDGEPVYDQRWLRRDLRRLRLTRIGFIFQTHNLLPFLNATIILADEPTAPLDTQRAGVVMDLLKRIAVDQQAAVLVVTHDETIFSRFDRLIELRDGRMVGEEIRSLEKLTV